MISSELEKLNGKQFSLAENKTEEAKEASEVVGVMVSDFFVISPSKHCVTRIKYDGKREYSVTKFEWRKWIFMCVPPSSLSRKLR